MRVDAVLKGHGVGGGSRLALNIDEITRTVKISEFLELTPGNDNVNIYLNKGFIFGMNVNRSRLKNIYGDVVTSINTPLYHVVEYKNKIYCVKQDTNATISIFDYKLNELTSYNIGEPVTKLNVYNNYVYVSTRINTRHSLHKYTLDFELISSVVVNPSNGNSITDLVIVNGVVYVTMGGIYYTYDTDLNKIGENNFGSYVRLAVASDNSLYVVHSQTIKMYDAQFNLLQSYSIGSNPSGIFVDRDELYVYYNGIYNKFSKDLQTKTPLYGISQSATSATTIHNIFNTPNSYIIMYLLTGNPNRYLIQVYLKNIK